MGIPLFGWALAPFSLWSNGADGACCASAPGRPAELRSKRISLGLIGGLWGVVIPRGLISTAWAEIPREWFLFFMPRAAQQVQIITPLYPIAHSKRRLKATFAQHRETGNLPPLPSPFAAFGGGGGPWVLDRGKDFPNRRGGPMWPPVVPLCHPPIAVFGGGQRPIVPTQHPPVRPTKRLSR